MIERKIDLRDDEEGELPEVAEPLVAIRSEFYNITDPEGWPLAGLIVLLDGKDQPVRAELHLYEGLPEQMREQAVRQGRMLLETRYYSPEPLPLRVLQSYPWRDTLHVRANATPISRPRLTSLSALASINWIQYWPYLAAAGGLLLLIAIIWGVTTLFGGDDTAAPTEQTPAAVDQGAGAVTTGITQTINAGDPNLPPSQKANPTLAVGKVVRVLAGATLSLVVQPGPDEELVGYLEGGESAEIVQGPVQTKGERDTIVWWKVRLANGTEAWAPANTSDLTLLEPME
jgi:hypothetical protein